MCIILHVRAGIWQLCAKQRWLLILGLLLWIWGSVRAVAGNSNEVKNTAAKVATGGFDRTNGVGSWIWDSELQEKQTCRFWKAFEIPKSNAVVMAELNITADNSYSVFLDGREV